MILSQGDIVRFDLNPSVGHEPRGKRPAMVVSSFDFNSSTSMTLVCPITSTLNEFPLHLELPEGMDTVGCVACEQVRAYDLEARSVEYVEAAPSSFVSKVTTCVRSFF